MASVPGCAPAPAAASSTPVVPGAAPRCRPEPQSRAGTARMTTWSCHRLRTGDDFRAVTRGGVRSARSHVVVHLSFLPEGGDAPDRKSTRLNSSHVAISYAVFCLKKKK